MSDYNDDAKYAKEKLATVSETMCLAKWLQTSYHLTTGHTNSCYHNPPHKMDLALNTLNDTNEKFQQKHRMYKGERPEGCSYCWRMEDKGHMSDRHYRSGEPWAMDNFNRVIRSFDTAETIFPTYVEVNFNSACNLKCSYCSPQYSSSWMAHSKQFGAYPTIQPHNDPDYFTGDRKPIPNREHNPYLEKFWDDWEVMYKGLRHFRMTGGEPLMDPNTYKVFDHVLENPKPDLHLNVTSNFSVEPDMFDKYMDYCKRLCEDEKIEHFMQFVSLDCFGERAEYIRDGLNFNRLWDNVNRFLNDIPHRNSVTFIITLNNLSITSLRELFTAIYGLREIYSNDYQRVWFDVPVLTDPAWQSIQILPESYSYKLEKLVKYLSGNPEESCEGFGGFKDYEVAKLQRDLDFMRSPVPEEWLNEQRVNFYRFFNEYDKRRDKNFLETFPEMEDFWSECMYRSKKYDQ